MAPIAFIRARDCSKKKAYGSSWGSRALDILIALTRHPGQLVSTRELITQVWRAVVVSPVALRVQMNALRKALGDGRNGVRYISNVAGMGYCFVAAIRVTSHAAQRAVACEADTVAASRVLELEQRIQELQQMLGEKTLEYETLRQHVGVQSRARALPWSAVAVTP